MSSTTEEAAAAADNERNINSFLTGCGSDWRVELVGDKGGLHYRIHDGDDEVVPFARLPVTVQGITVREVELMCRRAYMQGREHGVRATQQVLCQAIGAKWVES